MNRIISLNSFNTNNLQTLRAGALMVQQIVQDLFHHKNEASLLDTKKIGIVATEEIEYQGNKYFCIISTLCEGLDFNKLDGTLIYDYNKERSVVLKSKVATEIIPVLRVALNEEKNKILLLSDNMKFDFFSFGESKIKSTTLLFQLISNPKMLKDLSENKINKLEELIGFRQTPPVNSFNKSWRIEFLESQIHHLKEMQHYVDDIDLVEHYRELVSLEIKESSI